MRWTPERIAAGKGASARPVGSQVRRHLELELLGGGRLEGDGRGPAAGRLVQRAFPGGGHIELEDPMAGDRVGTKRSRGRRIGGLCCGDRKGRDGEERQ